MVALDRRIPHFFDSKYDFIGKSDPNIADRSGLSCVDGNRSSRNSTGWNILFPRASYFLEDVIYVYAYSIDYRTESIMKT